MRGEYEPADPAGEQLGRLSDSQLWACLEAPDVLFARVGADQKMRIVTILQREGLMLARRTIAKYREELKIPTSNQRKVLF